MNSYTENTHELIKVYYFEEFMQLSQKEFGNIMHKAQMGRFDLIIIEDYNE